jgi:hypothetical protein
MRLLAVFGHAGLLLDAPAVGALAFAPVPVTE